LEKIGKPCVYITTDNFLKDARSSAEDNGVPGMRIVAVPAASYYRNRISVAEVKPVADGAFNEIVSGLTKPISSAESTPKPKAQIDTGFKFTADSTEAVLEKFNEKFLENHWSDGLPLIPPTPARVKWILSGTSRSPKEALGTVAPKNGMATIEKIAINAVMAGAKPEYLPVIIAAMEALTDKNFNALHVLTSTGSFSLVIAVTGPIVKEIGLNYGIGYWGYGYRANSTIGRAVRLCTINMGYLWPAENDMALVGRPSSHTFYVVAENQDDSPWPPYHTGEGFKAGDSCVTVSTVGGYGTYGANIYGGGAVGVWTGESVLKRMIEEARAEKGPLRSMSFGNSGESALNGANRNQGSQGSQASQGMGGRKYLLLIHPELADELNRAGYTPASLRKYFSEQVDTSWVKPEDTHVIVAGGIPGYTLTLSYNRGAHLTKLIRGATLTKAGKEAVAQAAR
jgi:hypothetical protein